MYGERERWRVYNDPITQPLTSPWLPGRADWQHGVTEAASPPQRLLLHMCSAAVQWELLEFTQPNMHCVPNSNSSHCSAACKSILSWVRLAPTLRSKTILQSHNTETRGTTQLFLLLLRGLRRWHTEIHNNLQASDPAQIQSLFVFLVLLLWAAVNGDHDICVVCVHSCVVARWGCWSEDWETAAASSWVSLPSPDQQMTAVMTGPIYHVSIMYLSCIYRDDTRSAGRGGAGAAPLTLLQPRPDLTTSEVHSILLHWLQ